MIRHTVSFRLRHPHGSSAEAAYNAHPEHRAFVAERWASEVDDFLELDYIAYVGAETIPRSDDVA